MQPSESEAVDAPEANMSNKPEAHQPTAHSLTSMLARGGQNTKRIVCVTGNSSPEEGALVMLAAAQGALSRQGIATSKQVA
ncbi:hypothetical protein H4S08_001958 [Coemansia sp. RSA 1365]|nr:hypothetical protein H4S08_001958 [Coemansia sp. RSA 1365]